MFPERSRCPDCGRLICYHDFAPGPTADAEPIRECRSEDVKRHRDRARAAKAAQTRKLRRTRNR